MVTKIDKARAAAEQLNEKALLQQYIDFALAGHAGDAAKLAASEGYDVRKAVMDSIELQLPVADATAKEGTSYTWEERKSPSLEVLQLRDRLLAAAGAVTTPECVTIEVSRAQRITDPGNEDETMHYHTGIVVSIEGFKVRTRYRFYYAE